MDDFLRRLDDLHRRLGAQERLEHSGGTASVPNNLIVYSGTPTAGQVVQFSGLGAQGTVQNAGFAGSAVVKYTGVPVAGNMPYWTGNGTVADSGIGTSTLPRYSGTPTAGAITYWTGAGTVAHGSITYSHSSGTPTLAATSAAGMHLYDDGGNPGISIKDGGFVGIRIATPDADLHVHMDTNENVWIDDGGTGGISRIVAINDAGNTTVPLWLQGSRISVMATAGAALGVNVNVPLADVHINLATNRNLWVDDGYTGSLVRLVPVNDAGGLIAMAIHTANLTIDATAVGIGAVTAPQGQLHVDQDSTTAAVPVLILDQADLSEEFIEFTATVGAGNPIDTAAIGTYYGKVRVNVTGVGYKYIALYNT